MAYENLALIYDGFTDGSTSVRVAAEAVNGTVIKVYDEDSLVLLGTGTITLNDCVVTVSPALNKDQRIIAFVGDIGEKTLGGRVVLESGERSTGWQKPVTVELDGDEMTVEAYEALTGLTVPDIWNPSASNRTAELTADYIEQINEAPISFLLRIEVDDTQTVVTVEDVEGAPAGYLIKFDADAASNDTSKIYNSDGTYQVKVYDTNNIDRFKIATYNVDVTAPAPPVSEISNASYRQSDLLSLEIIADSDEPLEAKIDGVMGAYASMSFLGGKRWSYSTSFSSAAGTYTLRVRVIATPADAVAITATIY